MPRYDWPVYDLLGEIEEKVRAGYYKRHTIAFDPASDEGQDYVKVPPRELKQMVKPIPEEMYGPHFSGQTLPAPAKCPKN